MYIDSERAKQVVDKTEHVEEKGQIELVEEGEHVTMQQLIEAVERMPVLNLTFNNEEMSRDRSKKFEQPHIRIDSPPE